MKSRNTSGWIIDPVIDSLLVLAIVIAAVWFGGNWLLSHVFAAAGGSTG